MTNENKKTSEAGAHASLQIVTFKIGQEDYGVDIMCVQEIILPGDITKVPQVPDYVEGIINLRGKVMSVIDLRKRFKFKNISAKTDETRIIVASFGSDVMGFIVDAVNEVVRINLNQLEPAPEALLQGNNSYLKGVIKEGKRLLMLLDIEKLAPRNFAEGLDPDVIAAPDVETEVPTEPIAESEEDKKAA